MDDESLSNEEEIMDEYMDKAEKENDTNGITFADLRKLRHQDFVQSVKEYLKETNNKQIEIYITNLKKNIVLGFIKRTEKEMKEGTITRSKGGQFIKNCKEFVFETHQDDKMCIKIREILKKINKKRNVEKSKKRKQRKKDLKFGMVVSGLREMDVVPK